MIAQVVLLPRDLKAADVANRTVVVFDVLRATTTITTALAARVAEIRVLGSLESAREAAAAHGGPKLLCGELNCLPPAGFDLGNSPGQWAGGCYRGFTVFLSTTNGTGAIAAASVLKPAAMMVGSLINACAAAAAAAGTGRDITLLCAGSNGEVSLEDLLGAGAVLDELIRRDYHCAGDAAQIAIQLFSQNRTDLRGAMRLGKGGGNLIGVGLEADIDFCASLNSVSLVGAVSGEGLVVRSVGPI